MECYNNTLRSVLDKHAPVRARHLKSQSRPPWFNDEIVKARRERRSAERKLRASRLNSDLAVFKAKRNFALHVMSLDGPIINNILMRIVLTREGFFGPVNAF